MMPKWLDHGQTELNPEWLEWAKEATYDWCHAMGNDPAWYFPEDFNKAIPDEGAWVIVIDVPHTELSSRFEVPPLSVWRARRTSANVGKVMIPHGNRRLKLPFVPQQAVIATPGGDLHLWPTEYVVLSDVDWLVGQEPDVTMHSLGGEPVMDEEQLFYLQLRGISRQEAAIMLLSQITSLDFAYFTFCPEIAAQFEDVGVPLYRYIAKHPRSA